MSVIYNGTTLTLIKYNGQSIYAVELSGSKYCMSCSYSSSSCGSPCSASSSSSSCGTGCSLSARTNKCLVTCTLNAAILCDAECTASSKTSLSSYAMRRQRNVLLGTYEITPERSEWLKYMQNEKVRWGATCDTFLTNEDIPQEFKDDMKRIYDEVSRAVDEDIAVLETQLDEYFPNRTEYSINFEENKVYVYGKYVGDNDTANE